ncbi:glycosyltransferase family 2 protein [Cyanobacterium stanieri LEGE 03274]|uniref:Glycosyltransferase family 2 protein n=1 Tax=Cyanobacterium stanieri LEGE 03274 TaxID=1828756 RepID=A0ABR9V516_9CHRO|nr:glycosyltransferase family 2 protein [Cyanobacterium stanieri]MBE9222983.1 glycosyltransferase family 2 protein [Cyanobacterium stanieri LEGE 03274]
MSSLSISVVICTYNREAYLKDALNSLLNQDLEDYEIVVVDNASTDNTATIVKELLGDNPQLKYVYEPTLGLSVARNTGVKSTTGDIVAYLDDDAIAPPQWLKTLLRVFENDDQVAIAGGKVDLILPEGFSELPSWLSDDMAIALGFYDLGDEVKQIDDAGLTPRGLNYSFRRSFWQEVGGFDVKFDRVGKNLLSNGDLVFTETAIRRGKKVLYIPAAKVGHNVQPERLTKAWFLRRSWWQGVSEFYRAKDKNIKKSQQFFKAWERIARGIYKSFKYYQNPAVRFENVLYAYGQFGYLKHLITK